MSTFGVDVTAFACGEITGKDEKTKQFSADVGCSNAEVGFYNEMKKKKKNINTFGHTPL